MNVLERLLAARVSGDLQGLNGMVPYTRFLGISVSEDDRGLLFEMPFHDALIGNPAVPAIHGGAIGSAMEHAAILQALWAHEVLTVPKTINLTVDYLRPARTETTWARAVVSKRGRRVMNLTVSAWQSDPERLVATALVHLLVKTV